MYRNTAIAIQALHTVDFTKSNYGSTDRTYWYLFLNRRCRTSDCLNDDRQIIGTALCRVGELVPGECEHKEYLTTLDSGVGITLSLHEIRELWYFVT